MPFCSVRVISTIKRGARNCLKHSNARTLPSRLAGGLRTPCSSFISRRRPDLEQARSFAGEREAAFKIGTLRPKLSMSCLELLEECQGCSASDERQSAFDCGSSASFIGRRCRCSTELVARLQTWNRVVLRCAGRFYHHTWCAHLSEEALHIHAAEQALGSLHFASSAGFI